MLQRNRRMMPRNAEKDFLLAGTGIYFAQKCLMFITNKQHIYEKAVKGG